MVAGAILMVVGIILLAITWASSNIYHFPTDAPIYSPWIHWGFIIGGFLIMIIALVLGKESE